MTSLWVDFCCVRVVSAYRKDDTPNPFKKSSEQAHKESPATQFGSCNTCFFVLQFFGKVLFENHRLFKSQRFDSEDHWQIFTLKEACVDDKPQCDFLCDGRDGHSVGADVCLSNSRKNSRNPLAGFPLLGQTAQLWRPSEKDCWTWWLGGFVTVDVGVTRKFLLDILAVSRRL